MAKNVLDYIVTDLYYDLVIRACGDNVRFPVTENTQLRRENFDPQIVERVKADGNEDDLPDQIYMTNFHHRTNSWRSFHTEDDSSSVHIGAMNLFWHNESGQNHREHGPATVRISNLSRWHQNGIIHRPGKGPAITCRSVRFEWIYDTLYHREDGPEMVELHEVQMACMDGVIQEIGVRSINYRWTIENQNLNKEQVAAVLRKFNFGIDILALDSVFPSETDAFNFYNELVTEDE